MNWQSYGTVDERKGSFNYMEKVKIILYEYIKRQRLFFILGNTPKYNDNHIKLTLIAWVLRSFLCW